MALFGRYLAEKGALSAAQIEEATQAQVVYGGRLGTNLVELGHLALDALEQYLGDYLDTPVCPRAWLENPAVDALAAVPVDLVERLSALPLRIEARTILHIAMLDPNDERAVHEIQLATGLRIHAYVLAEVRLQALLEHHYELPIDVRFVDIDSRAQGRKGSHASPPAIPKSATSAPRPEDDEAARERVALGITPLARDQELIDEDAFTSLHADWEDAKMGITDSRGGEGSGDDAGASPCEDDEADEELREGSARPSVARLEAALAEAADRDDVSRIALRIGRCYAEAAALFVVRGGVVSGYRGDGDAIREQLDGILLPVEANSGPGRTAATRAPHRVADERSGIDATLLDALGRKEVAEFALQPVLISGRVSNLLYIDNGADPIPETAFAALGSLAELVAQAYERLILLHKGRLRESAE